MLTMSKCYTCGSSLLLPEPLLPLLSRVRLRRLFCHGASDGRAAPRRLDRRPIDPTPESSHALPREALPADASFCLKSMPRELAAARATCQLAAAARRSQTNRGARPEQNAGVHLRPPLRPPTAAGYSPPKAYCAIPS